MISEKDSSESSSVESPYSHRESPYSSPSQQVPHLANVFSGITCGDNANMNDGKKPYLRVVEQPQTHFRFRYRSEMVGTHGCIIGRTSGGANKNKTHPTVELVNYTGQALIRVKLAQADKDEEHPHKLLEDEQEDRDVSATVPEQGSYKVGFAGMGIIHTAKKDVPGLLFKQYIDHIRTMSIKELRAHCEAIAKSINLNIVRLRFSAHDIVTDREICPPVFSEPIWNMKSAATNDLKICRISRYYGRPRGGDDVFILVEKVNRKNVVIRFFELNEYGERVWSAEANFLQSDVHHQYAIVFRTPPYRDPQITKDVKVYIELVRPTDGRFSEAKEFMYKADHIYKSNKRKRFDSSFSSLESSSGGSLKSMVEIPITVEMLDNCDKVDAMNNVPVFHINIPEVPVMQPSSNTDLMADALLYGAAPEAQPTESPMLGQSNIPEPPVIQLNSSELERLINHDPHLPSEEKKLFCASDWSEYWASFSDSLPEKSNSMSDFIRSSMQLVTDGPETVKKEPVSPVKENDDKKTNAIDLSKSTSEYNAFYKAADGMEVKKLVKDICAIIKNKGEIKKQVVKSKLERLFEVRLSNGDTFLHMAVSSNQPSLEYIVKLIHSVGMQYLLNLTNDQQQTILHLAVVHDMPKLVPFLVSKGCDPMAMDKDGNNAFHYAVICNSCLQPLLEVVKSIKIFVDLDAYNNDKQTALHLAAIYNSESSAELLLRHGASFLARDSEGRTPLHLATYDDYLGVTRTMLQFIPPGDIDTIDGRGNTALQIVCGSSLRPNTLEIVKLLLAKNADPQKQSDSNQTAMQLARDKPALLELLRQKSPQLLSDDVKSEPEDDFESADEVDMSEGGLSELPLYIGAVSALLERGGGGGGGGGAGWRRLCARAGLVALLPCLERTQHAARALLTHIKETGEMTSKQLANHLEELGETEAANIIRQYTK